MGQINEICCASKEERKQSGGTDLQERMIRDNISKMHESRNLMLRPTQTLNSLPSTPISQKITLAGVERNFSNHLETRSFGMASEQDDQLLSPLLKQEEFSGWQKKSKLNKILTPTSLAERTTTFGSSGESLIPLSPQQSGKTMVASIETPDQFEDIILATNQQTYKSTKNRR